MGKRTFTNLMLAGAAVLAVGTVQAGVLGSSGTLNVVHGIPGVTVDVCASGEITGNEFAKVITDFDFKQIEVLELPEGAYDANVVIAGDDCDNPVAGLSASGLFLPGGANVSVVANQVPAGGFGFSVFVNDTSKIGFSSELIFRHTAAAPMVDAKFGKVFPSRTIPGLSFGNEGSARTFPGRVRIQANLAGTSTIALGPAAIQLARGSSNIVYVVGSAMDETLDVILQTIDRRSFGSAR